MKCMRIVNSDHQVSSVNGLHDYMEVHLKKSPIVPASFSDSRFDVEALLRYAVAVVYSEFARDSMQAGQEQSPHRFRINFIANQCG